MKTLIIKELKTGSATILSDCPDNVSAESIVNAFCKNTAHYRVRGVMPPVTWKVVEEVGFVGAMIESASL